MAFDAGDEDLLRRMAGALGFELVSVPRRGRRLPRWRISEKGRKRGGRTYDFFSPSILLARMLDSYGGFVTSDGALVRNLFYGMSREEAELTLAAVGV